MSEKKELIFSEGLFYDEFIIKGDGDYIILCDALMDKFKIMEERVLYLKRINQRYNLELKQLQSNNGIKISNPKALMIEYTEKMKKLNISWKKIVESNIKLEKKRKKLTDYYYYLKRRENNLIYKIKNNNHTSNLNKLRQENKALRYKNRILRIKNINLQKKKINYF
jgi:hypothetical protein